MLSKFFYIISVNIFVILMGILAIGNLDYTISEAIINEHSIFAWAGNMFGMLLAVVLLSGGRRRDFKWWNIVAKMIAEMDDVKEVF